MESQVVVPCLGILSRNDKYTEVTAVKFTHIVHFIEHITEGHGDMVQAMASQMHQSGHSLVESLVLLQNTDRYACIAWKLSTQRKRRKIREQRQFSRTRMSSLLF